MNKLLFNLTILCGLMFLTSCSSDELEGNRFIVGEWKLTSWSIGVQMDLNDDTIFSENLINEITCDYNEVLTFDEQYIYTSRIEYNADIMISKLVNKISKTTIDYNFNVECSEKIISTASEYTVEDGSVYVNGKLLDFKQQDNSIVFSRTIDIYDEALTSIVETKDLVLVFTKQ